MRPVSRHQVVTLGGTCAVFGAAAFLIIHGQMDRLPGPVALLTVLAVALIAPGAVLTTSLAGAFGVRRVNAAGVDLSVADALLCFSLVAAIPYVPWRSPPLRRMLRVVAVFLLLLAVVVVGTPTQRAMIEWGHRVVLVGGAVVVGAVLAGTATARRSVRLYCVVAVLVALVAVADSLSSGLAPAYPLGIQKNPAALLMAFALLTLIVTPDLTSFPPDIRRAANVILALGLMATRSRGTMIALLIVGFAWLVRTGRIRRTLPAALLVSGLLTLSVVATTQEELRRNATNPVAARFHGIGSRVDTSELTIRIWSEHPLLGAGLRYFRDLPPDIALPGTILEPHNVILATLGEGGLVGLVALGALLGGAFLTLRGTTSPLATIARQALVLRFIAALFDIYWVGGTGSLPWILVGLALVDDSGTGEDTSPRGQIEVRGRAAS